MGLMDQLKQKQAAAQAQVQVQLDTCNSIPTPPAQAPTSAKSIIEEMTANAPAPQQAVIPQEQGPKPKFAFRKVSPDQLTQAQQAPSATAPSAIPQVEKQKSTAVVPTGPKGNGAITVDSVLNIEVNTFERGSEKYTQEEVDALRGSIEMLKDSIKDAKVVGQAIKNVMFSLAENPELKTFMKPEDIGLMVKGLSESYGVQIAKRSEKAAKTETRKSKQKDMDDAFADLDFNV